MWLPKAFDFALPKHPKKDRKSRESVNAPLCRKEVDESRASLLDTEGDGDDDPFRGLIFPDDDKLFDAPLPPPSSKEEEEDKVKNIDAEIKRLELKLKMLREKRSLYLTQNVESKQKEMETVDAMEFMKKGSAMLKYGRFGSPHFRHFELSHDGQHLMWYSNTKKLDKSRIDLKTVNKLQKGQLTATFKKHLRPRLAPCSFSLIYRERPKTSKTLDVIAKNRSAYLLWTQGLQEIIDYHHHRHHHHQYEEEHPFPITVPVKVPQTNEKHIERRLSLLPEPSRKAVEREWKDATERVKKLMAICYHPKYAQNQHMEPVKDRLLEIDIEVEQIRHCFENNKLSFTAHQIWRTAEELKAIEHKIKAISKKTRTTSFRESWFG